MKANIKDIPCRIIEAMLFNQREQGNKIDIMVFKDKIDACKRTGGFDWYDTKGGSDFWADIIFEGDFDLFFADESKDTVKDLTLPYELIRIEMAKIYRYYVTKDLAATPTRIIDKMMEEQVAQGNVANVSVFDNNIISSSWAGGFDWHSTNEGEGFWHDVLIEHNFNLFDSVFSSEGKDKPIKKQTSSEPNIDDRAYPEEIELKMLEHQVAQGNQADITAFYKDCYASRYSGGFDWGQSEKGADYWEDMKMYLHMESSSFPDDEIVDSLARIRLLTDQYITLSNKSQGILDVKGYGKLEAYHTEEEKEMAKIELAKVKEKLLKLLK